MKQRRVNITITSISCSQWNHFSLTKLNFVYFIPPLKKRDEKVQLKDLMRWSIKDKRVICRNVTNTSIRLNLIKNV